MKNVIYLIGQISSNHDVTYEWRKDIRNFFKYEDHQFEIIDPCNNEFNTHCKDYKNIDPHRLNLYKTKGIGLLVPKDYSYVLHSTGAIANMNHYDTDKKMIGTLFELAWYYQRPEKCVIGVFNGDPTTDEHCNHPFVREAVDIWCQDHMEAAEILKKYYKRIV